MELLRVQSIKKSMMTDHFFTFVFIYENNSQKDIDLIRTEYLAKNIFTQLQNKYVFVKKLNVGL